MRPEQVRERGLLLQYVVGSCSMCVCTYELHRLKVKSLLWILFYSA